jgi:hypothetical protein
VGVGVGVGVRTGVKITKYYESFNVHDWHNCWIFSNNQYVSIMKHKTNIKILAPLLVGSCLFLHSCEPPLCAYCYDSGRLRIFDDRDIEICAEDAYELEEMVWVAESMGYRCVYK